MIWKAILIFLTSAVKFLFAPVSALHMGFSVQQTIIITTLGGCFGVLVFFGLSKLLQKNALSRRKRLILEGKKKPPRNFTAVNKAIVKIKRRLGLWGIAFVTLPFISIPLCAIIAAKFFRHKSSTLPLLLISVVLWSLILTFSFSIFY